MRLALAQMNVVVGDLDGNRERILAPRRAGARAGGRPRRLPRARGHRLSARGSPPAAGLRRAPRGRRSSEIARRDDGHRRARRRAAVRRRPLQRVRDLRRRRGRRRATASGTCRTTASSTRSATSRPGDEPALLDVAGTTASGSRSARTSGCPGRRRPSSRWPAPARGQPLGLAVPRRQGRRSARRSSRAGARERRSLALCNTGRRPGRARSSTGTPSSSRATARSSRERPASRRRCSSSTSSEPAAAGLAPLDDDLEQMRRALVLGLRDYVEKNGFGDVVVGVSGGIDSALTAALAVEALGAGARALRLDAVPLLVRRRRGAMRGGSPRTSAATSASSRSSRSSRRSTTCSRSRSPDASPTSRRRTSRRGSAARS